MLQFEFCKFQSHSLLKDKFYLYKLKICDSVFSVTIMEFLKSFVFSMFSFHGYYFFISLGPNTKNLKHIIRKRVIKLPICLKHDTYFIAFNNIKMISKCYYKESLFFFT